MDFGTIIGQAVLVGSLKKALEQGMVSNGYIFCGPSGSGKSLAAEVFARGLNCRTEGPDKPCGICSSCKRFESGNHPNIEILKPSGASIKIKQIREIISEVAKKPIESGYKVIIVDEADKMTQEAQDAFLKTLEEPPASTVFILLVENHHSLLPTVLSRCQVFFMSKVSKQQLEDYLASHYKLDYNQISFAAAAANGIIGKAVEILNNKELQEQRRLYVDLATKLHGGTYVELSSAAEVFLESRDSANQLLDFLLSWYRDILINKQGCESQLLVNTDQADVIERQAVLLKENQLYRIIDVIKRTISYMNHNVGTKNSIDSMLLNIMEVCNG